VNKLPAALALIERGFAVFPLTPLAKAPPLLNDWPRRAAKTPAEVETLWAAFPDANIAIHCEGLVVVDVDTRNDGDVSLQTRADLYDIPATLTTRTPSGGRHLFFRLPTGATVGNSAGRLGPGLDIKTTGGYVVAPGSDVEAGRYHFEADAPIAPAPAWLLDPPGPTARHDLSSGQTARAGHTRRHPLAGSPPLCPCGRSRRARPTAPAGRSDRGLTRKSAGLVRLLRPPTRRPAPHPLAGLTRRAGGVRQPCASSLAGTAAATDDAAGAAGSVNENVLPLPGSERTQIVPP
jgi:hypothetical protein